METIITQLEQLEKYRTSETYRATLRSFSQFRNGRDIKMDEITREVTQAYEAWLCAKGLTKNSTSFYMRILRAVYNRAVEKELTTDKKPFRHVYTGIDKTVKRAIPLRTLQKIKEINLSTRPSLEFARDLFLFSFYTRGMSFIDMAYLKKGDLNYGILSYRRRKTGQMLHIRWEHCMQEIVNKHPSEKESPFLLPILKNQHDRNEHRNKLHQTNKSLKQVGLRVGLSIPLTLYVARHSWASIARNQNIPISVISRGMGHESEVTTQIYLSSIDNALVDNANAQILSAFTAVNKVSKSGTGSSVNMVAMRPPVGLR